MNHPCMASELSERGSKPNSYLLRDEIWPPYGLVVFLNRIFSVACKNASPGPMHFGEAFEASTRRWKMGRWEDGKMGLGFAWFEA